MNIVKATLVTLALWATPVFAQNVGVKVDPCVRLGSLATSVMEYRQKGASVGNLMKIAKESELLRAIILAAYQVPRFSTEEYQQQAVADFGNEVMFVCYNNTPK